jgi:hypothetical protein
VDDALGEEPCGGLVKVAEWVERLGLHSSQKNSLETPVIVFDLAAEESLAKSIASLVQKLVRPLPPY